MPVKLACKPCFIWACEVNLGNAVTCFHLPVLTTLSQKLRLIKVPIKNFCIYSFKLLAAICVDSTIAILVNAKLLR